MVASWVSQVVNAISFVFINSEHCPQTNDHMLNFASLSVSEFFSFLFRAISYFITATFVSTVGSAGSWIFVSRSSVKIISKSDGFGRVLLARHIMVSVVLLNWLDFWPGSPLHW